MNSEQGSSGLDWINSSDEAIQAWLECAITGGEFEEQLTTHGFPDRDAVREETLALCIGAWATDKEADEEEATNGVVLEMLAFPILRIHGEKVDDGEPFPLSNNHLFRVACAVAIKKGFANIMQGLVRLSSSGFEDLVWVDYEKSLEVKLSLSVDLRNKLVEVVPRITIEHEQTAMLQAQLKRYAGKFLIEHGIQFEKGYLMTEDI